MNYKTTILKTKLYILAFLCSMIAMGQEGEVHEISLTHVGDPGKLMWNVIDGSIKVEGYDGDKVLVMAKGRFKNKSKQNKKERDGLRRIDENSLSYTIEERNNTVYISYSPGKSIIDMEVKVPRNFSLDLKTINRGEIIVDNVDGTHEVSNTNGPITMTNVGGSVIADALNKDLIISFKTIHSDTDMMFSSLNGDIDITFPTSLKATINARSDYGNVYTDFDIKMETKKSKTTTKGTNTSNVYKVKREKGIYGSINGGGADMTFKTLNGDILIRSN